MIARAYVAAGDDEKVWRVLEWLKNVHGGDSGSWFERYGQSITPPMPPVNVVGWIWYEIIALCVHHIAGVRPELTELVLRPHVLQGINEIKTTHTIRGSKLRLTVRKSKDKNFALVNGKRLELKDGSLRVPYPRRGDLQIEIEYRG